MQNFRESVQSGPPSDLHVLKGKKAILECGALLQQLAERCDQLGAMHWLSYFLGGAGARWKKPCLVLLLNSGANVKSLRPEDLVGAALFFELGALGIRTGAFSTDDWEGLRTVIAPPAIRSQFAARAVQALIQQGAHVALATYRYTPMGEKTAGPMLQPGDTLWAEYARKMTKHRLVLEATYEETLAKFGKHTRFNLRYYRKRLLAKMDCEFLEDVHSVVSEAEFVRMNTTVLNPTSVNECKRRYLATRDSSGGFLIGLREPKGRLLSVLGGWRHGTTTVMHHQMNAAGYEKDSLGTVMRAFFLEREIERGTRTVIFYHGTNHTMSHAFDVELLRDLVVRRKSLRARVLLKLASRLASPRYYEDVHYFGGSTTFFAGALMYEKAIWRSGPPESLDLAPVESDTASSRHPHG
jgi:hypothetical protein